MAANEQLICSDKQLLSRVFVSYLNSLVLLDPSLRTVVQISDERLHNWFGKVPTPSSCTRATLHLACVHKDD
ncbi:hypothetical protein T07_6779, partial [Trichinella nelsoni]